MDLAGWIMLILIIIVICFLCGCSGTTTVHKENMTARSQYDVDIDIREREDCLGLCDRMYLQTYPRDFQNERDYLKCANKCLVGSLNNSGYRIEKMTSDDKYSISGSCEDACFQQYSHNGSALDNCLLHCGLNDL
jgi:hypothetical protein